MTALRSAGPDASRRVRAALARPAPGTAITTSPRRCVRIANLPPSGVITVVTASQNGSAHTLRRRPRNGSRRVRARRRRCAVKDKPMTRRRASPILGRFSIFLRNFGNPTEGRRRQRRVLALAMERRFGRRPVPERLEEPPVVEPMDPIEGCELHRLNASCRRDAHRLPDSQRPSLNRWHHSR